MIIIVKTNRPDKDKKERRCKLIDIAVPSESNTSAAVDLVLIQPFLLCYVNHIFLMQTIIFKHNFLKKKKEVCIKARSTSASHSLTFPISFPH